MGRTIGVSHRVKFTVNEEARPTLVAIRTEDGSITEYQLETEDEELDFARCQFPVSYRTLGDDEPLKGVPMRHVKMRKLREREVPEEFPEGRVFSIEKTDYLATKIPTAYDGLKTGDAISMILGGSGNRLAFALSHCGEQVGATVFRIPAHALKAERGSEDTAQDHFVLEQVLRKKPELFHAVTKRDRSLIKLTEQYRLWEWIQQDRKACGLRLRTQSIGARFLTEDGGYPQGSIEEEFDRLSATDGVLAALRQKEARAKKEMEAALADIPVWTEVLSKVEGVGASIAAGIIAAVGDVSRFQNDAKLKAFLGVHVMPDGSFPRKRRGVVCNWNPAGRQALYKFFDQMNRRPKSYWGQQFIGWKQKLRERHPEVVIGEGGKKKYTNAHIHKMAAWRTLTKFVEWLYVEWKRADGNTPSVALQKAA